MDPSLKIFVRGSRAMILDIYVYDTSMTENDNDIFVLMISSSKKRFEMRN